MSSFFQEEHYKLLFNGLGCRYLKEQPTLATLIITEVLQVVNDWCLDAIYRGNQHKIRQHPGSQDVVQGEACYLITFSNLCSVLSPCYCTADAVISLLRAWGQWAHKQTSFIFFKESAQVYKLW
uniref:Uncharacterized protein n=1 Tax=Rousettus aegyptiacus TaxID=9407 RepID=A0A7J8HRZ7_ROUAE|nr:hypothetical protein HJG63_010981 [Rousettus aegyptiacus]